MTPYRYTKNTDENLARLRAVRAFLLDMDGTFYLGDRLLPGALDFLGALALTGRQALFLTNNSSKSASAYREKLCRLGVPEAFRNVYTSGQAAGSYLLRHDPGKTVFLLGTSALAEELAAMGVPVTRSLEAQADLLLVGYDTSLDYAKLAHACDLARAGLPYIATHPDLNCPTETGCIPDIGAILAFIEASAKRKPDTVIGKPFPGIADGALGMLGVSREEAAMCGDRLYTDVAVGVNAGMLAVMVLSGEAAMADLEDSPVQPDLVFGKLADMIPYLVL